MFVVNGTGSLCLSHVCDYLLNSLNEVLNGFSVDFNAALGTDRTTVLESYRQLKNRCADEPGALLSSSLNRNEAEMLVNCSRLCRKEVDSEEFQTRLGISLEDAMLVEDALANLIER